MENKLRYKFSENPNVADLESGLFQQYTVDRGINSSRAVSFFAEGQANSFINLSQCYVKTVFRVVKSDGSALGDADSVFPTENFGTNLWSQINISLNNSALPPGNDYAYTAFLIDLLGASPEAREAVMKPLAGWEAVGYSSSKIADALPASYSTNKAKAKGSNLITVYDRIHSDFLMTCSQLLPSRMRLGITLTRSKDEFVLGCDMTTMTDTYKIEMMSVSLFVRREYLNPAARSLAERELADGGKLFYQRLQTLAFPCPEGSMSFAWYNCLGGFAPTRAFLAVVSQEAYFGSLSRTSNYLESAGISTVRFCLDGRDIMAEPYQTTFVYDENGATNLSESDALSPFQGFCQTLGTMHAPRAHMGVKYDSFKDGCLVFAVALDHS